jgi:exo-beta-1,3-glucanase (GH17 family)
LGHDTMIRIQPMTPSRSYGSCTSWPRSTVTAFAAALMTLACGFDEVVPAAQGGTAGTAPTSTAGAAAASATAGSSNGGSAGAPGGGTGVEQGGQQAQAGTAAQGGASAGVGAGSAGSMSVAGGPPAFSTKPMSVVAYSPYRDGQAPGGTQPTQAQVREDLELLRPLVDGVRVYGTDGANAYVPALCDELGIELHIGAWIDGQAFDEPNTLALAELVNENHPSIKTAIIGNEVLQRSAENGMTEEKLLALINTAKGAITNKNVKIAAADTYPQWMLLRPNLAAAVDLVIWHTYGYWAGINIEGAYALVSKRYDDMLAAYPGKPLLLGETGWPTMTQNMSQDLTTTAVGSQENQARFYREALAGFRARNLPTWMFSAIDEKWKGTSGEGEVGAYWGIFTSARQPKIIATELLQAVQ